MVSAAAVPTLHADEAPTDAALARRLVAGQFPQWAGLAVTPIASGATHALYRLGEDKVVRLPRGAGGVSQIDKEFAWLAHLAPRLPLEIPRPLARGGPGPGFDWDWSIYAWIEGTPARLDTLADPSSDARALAGFIQALQACGAPPADLRPGPHNYHRGHDLRRRDARTRESIDELAGEIDAEAAAGVWNAAMAAAPWVRPPVWIHGDLMPGNLLVRDGRLAAVIDFGGLGGGDPACELFPAWNLFEGPSREAFRTAVGADGEIWARGRGWALHQGLMALPYYRDSDPAFAVQALATIEAVTADWRQAR